MEKSISLAQLEKHLAEFYQPQKFKDYCPKGLFIEGTENVTRITTGVSLCQELIDASIQQGSNCIIVHHPHGFWDNQHYAIRGPHKHKIKKLLDHQVSVFSFHLPMDAHPTHGNNIQLAQSIGLNPWGSFANHGGVDLGLLCSWDLPKTKYEAHALIKDVINPSTIWLGDGPNIIQNVAILTGAAPNEVQELIQLGKIDAYITGEARENTDSLCKENQIHFIAAGHHQTETFGPKALANHLATQFQIQCNFINIHNPI